MWCGWLVRLVLVLAALVSRARGAPDPRAFALDERGVPLTPPAFPASFRAEVEQRVTRAEGKTNVRPTLDDDADAGEFPDEATEPVLATIYHERRMQAERVDVHAPAPVSFLFLFSRGVAYQLTDDACHTAPIRHPMTNARLTQAATFLGKVNITRLATLEDHPDATKRSDEDSESDSSDSDSRRSRPSDSRSEDLSSFTVSAERWSNAVPGYDESEEVFVARDPDGGRFSKPVRDVFRRVDRGADIEVTTDYLEWSPRRSDPALFRPPPASAGCVPSPSGTLAIAVERRNTLHFNPLHVPRLDPGERVGDDGVVGTGAGAGPGGAGGPGAGAGAGPGAGALGFHVDAGSSGESGSGSESVPPWRAHLSDDWRIDDASSGGVRLVHPDEAAAARAAAAARGDRDPYEAPRRVPDSNRFDTAFRHPRDRGRVRPGVVDGLVAEKDDGSGPTTRGGGAGAGGRGGGGREL